MNLRRLQWITTVVPVLFLAALDYVRHDVAPGLLHTPGGFVLIGALVTAATATFSHFVFRAIARMQRRLDRQTAQLRALYAESEQRRVHLDQLINSSGDAIITTDLNGRIRTWSNGAEAIYGFTRAEAVGQHLPMVPPDRAEEARLLIERVLRGETATNFETVRVHKSGRRLAVMVTASPIVGPDGKPTGVMGVSKDLTDKRRLELQERRLTLLEERERIAMDLHDGAIQSIYAVGLRLEAAVRLAALSTAGPAVAVGRAGQVAVGGGPDVRPVLTQAVDELNRVIQEIRDYVRGLGPRELAARGLVEGMEALMADLRDTALIAATLTVSPEAAAHAAQLDGEQVGQLLQITREALSNVARHARASTVTAEVTVGGVSLWRGGDSVAGLTGTPGLRLVISDNGCGFDAQMLPANGRGLRNLKERAAALGGRATFISAPGSGTAVVIHVPGRSSVQRASVQRADEREARLWESVPEAPGSAAPTSEALTGLHAPTLQEGHRP